MDRAIRRGTGQGCRLPRQGSRGLKRWKESVLRGLKGKVVVVTGGGGGIGSATCLRFAGEASATPEREGALSNLLNIIGRRNGARSLITLG